MRHVVQHRHGQLRSTPRLNRLRPRLNPIRGARNKLPRVFDQGEQPVTVEKPVGLVKAECSGWDVQLTEFMKNHGFTNYGRFSFNRWDSVKPEHRVIVEELWDAGYNRVTRWKMGFFMEGD